MKQVFFKTIKRMLMVAATATVVLTACKKNDVTSSETLVDSNNELALVTEARKIEQTAANNANSQGAVLGLGQETNRGNKTIVEIAVSNPHFTSLVAAVVKTGLAGALSDKNASLTVFAPTNAAFASLPAPFNNAANINGISSQAQIDFLKNVLLYHVLGAEVKARQISDGASSAATLKAQGSTNENTVYLSKNFGLIRLNGQTNVIWADVDASNGVIHVIDKVLLFPTQNIAQIAIGNPSFSSLVAALVKTNLAGVFTGAGNFTVFAPTNAGFAKLPAPFNNATNIGAITNQAQIDALANILKYHVVASRNFNWDFGILKSLTTLASPASNKLTTIIGYNTGWVKGKSNNSFNNTNPSDILATNGVVHVIGDVLIP
jgi:uncharacterized surface protein with fasciclin (FAS1) repeats